MCTQTSAVSAVATGAWTVVDVGRGAELKASLHVFDFSGRRYRKSSKPGERWAVREPPKAKPRKKASREVEGGTSGQPADAASDSGETIA